MGNMLSGHCECTRCGEKYSSVSNRKHVCVAVCEVCGGKYRPAGGSCIHEHPKHELRPTAASDLNQEEATVAFLSDIIRDAGPVRCLTCGVVWQPGHACIAQPTPQERLELSATSAFLRAMEEVWAALRDFEQKLGRIAGEVK